MLSEINPNVIGLFLKQHEFFVEKDYVGWGRDEQNVMIFHTKASAALIQSGFLINMSNLIGVGLYDTKSLIQEHLISVGYDCQSVLG